jgi:hypothetical protein
MDPAKFLEGYATVTAKNADGYVARYWTNLSLEPLKILATEGQKDINEGLAELSKYERFPLAPPGDRKDDLTAQEVVLARAALEKIKGATGAAIAAGTRSVGQGGLTRDKDIDAILERLRGVNLLKEYQQYLDRLEKFFVVLPTDNKPITMTLSIAKDKLKDNNQGVSIRFASAKIAQGNKQLGETYVQSPDKESFDIEYPGADLTLAFRDVRDGPIIHTETIPGIWIPFRLIKDPKVKVLSREVNKDKDGSRWLLEYTVKEANGKSWLIYFALDFKGIVPELNDWPVPPTK